MKSKSNIARRARYASVAFLLGGAAIGAIGCRQVLGIEDPVPCTSDDACNEADQPCISGECIDGACVFTQRDEGFVVDEAGAADCKSHVCDANGEVVVAVVASDVPADDTPGDCLVPACDANGEVVAAMADDPPPDMTAGDCMKPGCDNGMVESVDDPTDTPEADIAGDCHKPTCDGGAPTIDDTDVPATDCAGCVDGVVTAWAEAGTACYDGPTGTQMVGDCKDGTWTCDATNTKVCDGEVTPTQEQCGTGFTGDEDCDGQTDEEGLGCACTIGQSQSCYTGPSGTAGVGVCKAGTSSCITRGTGNVFGPCTAEVVPTWDSCVTSADDDCSGTAEACTGGLVFAKSFGSGIGSKVVTLADGSLVATGLFSGSIVANNTINSDGGNDVFVLHLDPLGNGIKAKALGGVGGESGGQVVATPDGFVVGVNMPSTSSETFGGTVSYTPQGTDGFITKYDENLVHQWTVQIGGTGNESIIALENAPNGGVVVVGSFSSPSALVGPTTVTSQGGEDFFVARLNASGQVLWAKNIGGASNDEVTGVAVNPAGEVFVAGSTDGPIAYAGASIPNAGSFDAFVVKLDAMGTPVWQQAIQSSGLDGWPEVAVRQGGDVWVTIASASALNVNGVAGADLSPVGTGADQFLMHYSAAGAYLGGSVFDSTGSSGISVRYRLLVSPDDSLVFVGTLTGDQTIGATATSAGQSDALIAKVSPSAAPLWIRRYGGTDFDGFGAGSIDPQGNIVVAGRYVGSVSFGGGSLPYTGSGTNIVVAKYHQ